MSDTPQSAAAPESFDLVPFEYRVYPFEIGCKTLLGICPNTAMKLARQGVLETFKIGSRRYLTGGAAVACQKKLAAKERKAVQS